MKKKKILFFLQTLNGGGAERVTVNIIKILDKERFDISLVLVNKEGVFLDLIPKNVKIYSLDSSKTLFSIFKLRELINKLSPDIIYSTLYRTHIALYFALLGNKKIKTIMRMPNSPKLVIENGELSFLLKIFLDISLKRASLVLAQTPQMKDEISYYHNVNSSKIEVLLNPIDKDFIDSCIKDTQNPFDKSYINLVASGRLTYQKGFDILIRAFAKVYQKDNRYRLYILGKDLEGLQKEYVKLAKELNIEKFVTFLGFKSNPYKYYYYADIFVLSSRWEGLPNTVLESLYLGTKVVATRCIPYMQTLIDSKFLCDIEDSSSLSDIILRANESCYSIKEGLTYNSDITEVFDI